MQKEVDDVSFLLFESRKEQTDSQCKNTQRERRADWIFTAWKQRLKQTNKKGRKSLEELTDMLLCIPTVETPGWRKGRTGATHGRFTLNDTDTQRLIVINIYG